MPNKRGHDISHIADLVLWTYAVFPLGATMLDYLVGTLGIMYTVVFAYPDRDLQDADQKLSIIDRFWLDYGYRHKHRSPHKLSPSHFPVISTLVRFEYAYRRAWGIAGGILGYVVLVWVMIEYWALIPWRQIGVFVALACIADINHIALDVVWSNVRPVVLAVVFLLAAGAVAYYLLR